MKAPARGRIIKPEAAVNVTWQTRTHEPTEYENRLGDALEKVFAAGAEQLPEVVKGLNDLGFKAPDGSAWTEDSFQAEMRKLAG